MSDIGLRSGKIEKGKYKFGKYVIVRQPSDYWWVLNDGKFVHQARTLSDANYWCRQNNT